MGTQLVGDVLELEKVRDELNEKSVLGKVDQVSLGKEGKGGWTCQWKKGQE